MKFAIFLLFICVALALPQKKTFQKASGGRIIGGSVARSGQFPFAAAIYTITEDGNYFCGGALLNKQWIITAAQCVDNVSLFNIHLGTNSLLANDPYAVKVSADIYTKHPDYNPETLDNDIALIWLRIPVEFSDYLRPIDFFPSEDLPQYSAGTAIGWGQTSDDTPGLVDDLHWVHVTALSNEECKQYYGNSVTDNMVCVDGNYNEGTCLGDSGSPLVQFLPTGQSILVGISSFLSFNGCETTDPSGFARVFKYVDWIKNHTVIE